MPKQISGLIRLYVEMTEQKMARKALKNTFKEDLQGISGYADLKEELDEVRGQMKALRDQVFASSSIGEEIASITQEIKETQAEIDLFVAGLMSEGKLKYGETLEINGRQVMPTITVKLKQLKLEI